MLFDLSLVHGQSNDWYFLEGTCILHGALCVVCSHHEVPSFTIYRHSFRSNRLSRSEEINDMVASMSLASSALREGGVKVFGESRYLTLEERVLNTKIRSLCAQSYHFVFKMMAQCIYSIISTAYIIDLISSGLLGDFSGAVVSGKHSVTALLGGFGHCFWIYHFFLYPY